MELSVVVADVDAADVEGSHLSAGKSTLSLSEYLLKQYKTD